MSRTLGKMVRLCNDFDATTGKVNGDFIEILFEDHERRPNTIEEVEALVETSKVASADKAKCRTLIAAHKAKVAEGVAKEAAALEAKEE